MEREHTKRKLKEQNEELACIMREIDSVLTWGAITDDEREEIKDIANACELSLVRLSNLKLGA